MSVASYIHRDIIPGEGAACRYRDSGPGNGVAPRGERKEKGSIGHHTT